MSESTYDSAMAAVDPASIASMTPEEAAAKYAELTAAYQASQVPPTDGAPAVSASRQLRALAKDGEFNRRLESGNKEARETVDRLTRAMVEGEADLALAGEVPDGWIDRDLQAGASLRDQISGANDFRTQLSEEGVRQYLASLGQTASPDARAVIENSIRIFLNGGKPTPEMYRYWKEARPQRFADQAWVERLNRGDPLAKTEFLVSGWIITAHEAP